ncbi:Lrp/AsnC family transcriptional regulator [Methanocella sp. MCL-LM]|uniref:Lrp/AsnC family transcriptional regulator n=1 Tax=Methanocella sp. MCL-LM TaxID=3412035 RepID=UPI003C78BBDA
MAYKSVKDLDAVDIKIIEKLCKDSSASLSDIAQELGVSASTVHKRINQMRENHIIERFTILFDPSILNLRTVAFVGIELERDALMGKKKEEVLGSLSEIPYIMEIHETLAPFDLILKLRTRNVEKLRGIITSIAAIDGVMATNTILTTNRILERYVEVPNSNSGV